ncbi:MAG: adenylate/guanylate cyclase domain-containing protein [Gaiellaceae bacterium]
MADLPKGTVTFLFTDIEGSTRLLKQLRERYAGVLTEHQRILRAVFAEAGGQEVDTQGDAFFVAFRGAKDAVAAAVAAQRALAAHAWPDGLAVRIRMGIHTGEPTVGADRYVGLGVHRAARICSAGHGGQVLLSNATRELIEDELPSDVDLLDLGEQHLKDIDRPERIFQLEIDGLPAEFPPLKTLEGQPPEATPFAGREGELARAAEAAVAGAGLGRRRALLLGALAGVIAAAVSVPIFALGGESEATRTSEANGPRITVRPNSIAVIDPETTEIVASIPVGAGPGPIAVGEGSVWVANVDEKTVMRIDPKTREVVETIGLGIEPTDLAVGKDAVWVAGGFDRALWRIDTADNVVRHKLTIREVIGPLPAGFELGPSAVAVGEGAVWLAHGEEVSRIDPAAVEVVETIPAGGNWSGAIAVGEGAVWVVENGRLKVRRREGNVASGISRIDPASNSVEATIAVPGLGGQPPGTRMVAAGAGAVWASVGQDQLLWRVDPRTNLAAGTTPAGQSPVGVAVGEGAVWVEHRNDGTVTRIDPFSNKLVETIRIGHVLRGVAAGEGAVWVSVVR